MSTPRTFDTHKVAFKTRFNTIRARKVYFTFALDHEDRDVQTDLDFSAVDVIIAGHVVHEQLTGDSGHDEGDKLGDEQENHEENAAYRDGRARVRGLREVLGNLTVDVESENGNFLLIAASLSNELYREKSHLRKSNCILRCVQSI
jgi:hypothetical protein